MVYDYFPYMIQPIYSIQAKMDVKLIEPPTTWLQRFPPCPGDLPPEPPRRAQRHHLGARPLVRTSISPEAGQRPLFPDRDAIETVTANNPTSPPQSLILMVVLWCACVMKYLTNPRSTKGAGHEYRLQI
jgi:hypothetical protein